MSLSAPPPVGDLRLACLSCEATYSAWEVRYRCDCGGVLEVLHAHPSPPTRQQLDERLRSRATLDRSGVWRFREMVLPLAEEHIASRPEGNTPLYRHPDLSAHAGVHELLFKHEGENPTGSFKDRGMTTGLSMARALGQRSVACASTGNTSASMAAYASLFGLRSFVFIPEGAIAFGKLAQALAYGATTLQIRGDFDDAMRLVESLCARAGVYLLNSLNPFRLEGQKSIAMELVQDLGWDVPDWLVVPGGNLGNASALHKGLRELHDLGLIHRLPRLAIIQAAGANPLVRAVRAGETVVAPLPRAQTLATAIRIGAPVSGPKALRALRELRGVVEEATDKEILEAKALLDRCGIGAEPASCTTLVGVKKLRARGVISAEERVVCVLTGHVLKDPEVVVDYHLGRHALGADAPNTPLQVDADENALLRLLDSLQTDLSGG